MKLAIVIYLISFGEKKLIDIYNSFCGIITIPKSVSNEPAS